MGILVTLLLVRVVKHIGECGQLIDARLSTVCVKIADFVDYLSRLKATSSTKTHSFCLDIEIHESVLIWVKFLHEGIISANSQLHIIFHFNESQRCPKLKLDNIRNENFCFSHFRLW